MNRPIISSANNMMYDAKNILSSRQQFIFICSVWIKKILTKKEGYP